MASGPEAPWYRTYRQLQADFTSPAVKSLSDLELSCKRLIQEVELDPHLDQRMKRKIQANYALKLASSSIKSHLRKTLRNFVRDIPPEMQRCDKCGKDRLVIDKLQDWEQFHCGSGLAFFPERACGSPDDLPNEWCSPVPRDLNILAMAAESLSKEDKREMEVRQISSPKALTPKKRSRRKQNFEIGQTECRDGNECHQPMQDMQNSELLARIQNDARTQSLPAISQGPEQSPDNQPNSNDAPSLKRWGSSAFNPVIPSFSPLIPATPSKQQRKPLHQSLTPKTSSESAERLQDTDMGSLTIPDSLRQQLDYSNYLYGHSDFGRGSHAGLSTGSLVSSMPNKSTIAALGRAISDPHVLQRELALGIPPLEEEEPVNCATAATVLRAGVENTSYSPGRPLSRAISDPKKMRLQYSGLTPAEAAASDLGINLPPRQSFVDWQAVIRFPNSLMPRDLFSVGAALPIHIASSLPEIICLDGICPRDRVQMHSILEAPLMLRLGQVDDVQRNMVEKMEQNKLGLFAHFPTFDFVLFPVLNTRKLLHIVGLRIQKEVKDVGYMPKLARTVSAMPGMSIDKLQGQEFSEQKARSAKRKLRKDLDTILEDRM